MSSKDIWFLRTADHSWSKKNRANRMDHSSTQGHSQHTDMLDPHCRCLIVPLPRQRRQAFRCWATIVVLQSDRRLKTSPSPAYRIYCGLGFVDPGTGGGSPGPRQEPHSLGAERWILWACRRPLLYCPWQNKYTIGVTAASRMRALSDGETLEVGVSTAFVTKAARPAPGGRPNNGGHQKGGAHPSWLAFLFIPNGKQK
jgi:hypothetical protein